MFLKSVDWIDAKYNLHEQLYISRGRHEDELQVPVLVERISQNGHQEIGDTVSLVDLKVEAIIS